MVQDVGYSQRHLLNLFRRWVGITPKQYGRIGRFQRTLHSLTRGDTEPDPLDWPSTTCSYS